MSVVTPSSTHTPVMGEINQDLIIAAIVVPVGFVMIIVIIIIIISIGVYMKQKKNQGWSVIFAWYDKLFKLLQYTYIEKCAINKNTQGKESIAGAGELCMYVQQLVQLSCTCNYISHIAAMIKWNFIELSTFMAEVQGIIIDNKHTLLML